jgi:hypothetical protein
MSIQEKWSCGCGLEAERWRRWPEY